MMLVLRRVEHRECERSRDGHDDSDDDAERDREAFDEHGQTIGKWRPELDALPPAVHDMPGATGVGRFDQAADPGAAD